jgi:glycosyltransferase involved in cell wall biosynthesis
VVLSVGALNDFHKRMAYLVREVGALPDPRPFVVMLGQVESDTPAVLKAADAALGPGGYVARTIPREQLSSWYQAADVFALCSLTEGFGLAYAEALAHGLPCLAHDFPVSRFVLGEDGTYADLSRPGALAPLITAAMCVQRSEDDMMRCHRSLLQRFSWQALLPAYVDMFQSCIGDGARVSLTGNDLRHRSAASSVTME